MVKLEEVLDEEFTADQKGPEGGEEDWDTDTGVSNHSATRLSIRYYVY